MPSSTHLIWGRHQIEASSALLAFCAGNSPVTGEFPAQSPVTRSFDVFFDLRLNKRLSKQPRGWWFETPSGSLWRHCNGKTVSTHSVWCIGAVSMINLLNQMSFSNHIYCNHECQTNIYSDEGNILSDQSCWWYWISPPRAWAAGFCDAADIVEPNVVLWQPVGQIVHTGPVIERSSIIQHCTAMD